MPRLTLQEREVLMDTYDGHYALLLKQSAGWEIEEGFGLGELRALFQTYLDTQNDISTNETTLSVQRNQRDALFGRDIEDINGIWFVLGLYKQMARSRLPKSSALRKTDLTIGKVSPAAYDAILGRFIEHWKLVNAALPVNKPLVIAGKTLADVQALRQQIADLKTEITETLPTRLEAMRSEREQLFGDVIADEREPTSIIGRLESYGVEVKSQFAGDVLTKTIPRIFPDEAATPRFAFNFRVAGSDVVIWWTMRETLQNRAAVIYLKAGSFAETRSIPAAPYKVTFAGAEPEDGLDAVELRNADSKTIAKGRHDASLSEPA